MPNRGAHLADFARRRTRAGFRSCDGLLGPAVSMSRVTHVDEFLGARKPEGSPPAPSRPSGRACQKAIACQEATDGHRGL